jgi:hypothetical protein
MKLVATILLVMSGVLFAQDTNDPTDTPTVRSLTALLPLRDQANYGRWLVGQNKQAQFAEWLMRQDKEAQFAEWLKEQIKGIGPAKFAAALSQPALLLQVKEDVDRPNYEGNAFEEVRKNAWLRFARGESIQ